MAGEAQLRDRIEHPINFTVADGTGIEKGALLKLTDPRTAIAVSAASDMIAGIAAEEKIASDGKTSIGVFRRGIFDMKACGPITAGQPVSAAATPVNWVKAAPLTTSGGQTLGIALETAADNETIQLELNIGVGSSLS